MSTEIASAQERAARERQERLDQALLLWQQALEAGSPPDLGEFLRAHASVAAELREILGASDLDDALNPLRSLLPKITVATPGTCFGDYEVIEELSSGAFGVVYKARQRRLDRVVALKLLRVGAHGGIEDLARFQREAEALAKLRHPNIVHVYDQGVEDGWPYIAMEFCAGGSLANHLDGTPLQPAVAARLVHVLASAVQAVHQEAIVHRDLKPANVLLPEERRGTASPPARGAEGAPVTRRGIESEPKATLPERDLPEARSATTSPRPLPRSERRAQVAAETEFANPKIADFGLAKSRKLPGDTTEGAVVGTPSYMAPEQARGQDATAASDIYALGAILYELLTGRAPFKAPSVAETLVQVINDDPVPVRRLVPKVNRDLETICHKCLQKEPGRRYLTARALAKDLENFLGGKPIKARPVSPIEWAWKWACREPLAATLTALVVFLVIFGIGSVFHAWRQSEAGFREKEEQKYVSDVRLADRHIAALQLEAAEELLKPYAVRRDLRGWEWHYLWGLRGCERRELVSEKMWDVQCLAFSPDGSLLATGSLATRESDETAILWEAATGRRLPYHIDAGHIGGVGQIGFTGDGSLLVTSGHEGIDGATRVWDVKTGEAVRTLEGRLAAVARASPLVATAVTAPGIPGKQQYTLHVWDAASGEDRLPHTISVNFQVEALALSRGGRYLAAGGFGPSLRVWEVASGKEVILPAWHQDDVIGLTVVRALTFHPDKDELALAGRQPISWTIGGAGWVHFAGTGKLTCSCLAYSEDGKYLAGTYYDGLVRVWETQSQTTVQAPPRHTQLINSVAFQPKTNVLAVTRGNRVTVEKVFVDHIEPNRSLRGPPRPPTSLRFSPDGSRIATRADDGSIPVWDVGKSEPVRTLPALAGVPRDAQIDFRSDRILIGGGSGNQLNAWDLGTRSEPHTEAVQARTLRTFAFSPDGQLLASARGDTITVEARRGGTQATLLQAKGSEVLALCFHPQDRKLLASSGTDGTVRWWDVVKGKQLRMAPETPSNSPLGCVAFSPDGTLLAAGGADLVVRVWDVKTGRELARERNEGGEHGLRGHAGEISGVCFSANSDRLASCSYDGTIRIWDARTWQELLVLTAEKDRRAPVTGVAFSPDGRLLASCHHDGTVRIWDGTNTVD